MVRQDIHKQIQQLSDKIARLNYTLKEDDALHAVEIDLLKGYASELNKLVALLEAVAVDTPVETSSNEVVEEEVAEVDEPGTVPEVEYEAEVETTVEEIEIEVAEEEVEEEEVVMEETEEVVEEPEEEATMEDEQVAVEKEEFVEEEMETPAAVEMEEAPESVSAGEYEEDNDEEEEEEDDQELSLNDRFKGQTKDLASKLKRQPTESLRNMIDLSEKYEFINELFAGDGSFFDRTLRQLDQCQSYDEAMEYLDTEVKYQVIWEGKEKHEEKLMDLISRRFSDVLK